MLISRYVQAGITGMETVSRLDVILFGKPCRTNASIGTTMLSTAFSFHIFYR